MGEPESENRRYFTHDKYAGLSAFVSKAASEEERNANFVSVGILVPQTYGRLGRAWMHAQRLRELARWAIFYNVIMRKECTETQTAPQSMTWETTASLNHTGRCINYSPCTTTSRLRRWQSLVRLSRSEIRKPRINNLRAVEHCLMSLDTNPRIMSSRPITQPSPCRTYWKPLDLSPSQYIELRYYENEF